MAGFSLRIALLCVFAVSVWSDRDPDFCTVPKESCGLIPPPLPTNFIMMRESAIPRWKTLQFESLYFDNVNQVAKYVNVSSGIEQHHIFDYETEQVISYYKLHPGVESKKDPESDICKAIDMGFSPLSHIFGYRGGALLTKRSKMFNSYEVLRFGGEYMYSADDTEVFESRGFPANKFVGCIYDAFTDVTANITYYFSTEKMTPAGGTGGFNAEGTLFLSVPLAARYRGIKYLPDKGTNETVPPLTFDVSAHIPWFIGEPEFDYDTFKVPQWMHCEGRKGIKQMNKLPERFSTRMEMSLFSQNQFGRMTAAEIVSYEQIYYDRVRKLARRDYKPSVEKDLDIFKKFGNYGRVKEIFDFNVGVSYVIHLTTSRCYVRDIKSSDYFQTQSESMFDIMKTPEELFSIDSERQIYKGKYFARDIETDVWAGKTYDDKLNITFYKETYISTDGWHEEANEKSGYSVPVRQTIITDIIGDEGLTQTVNEKNFFKFKAATPPLVVFNTAGCSETLGHTIVFITLDIAPQDETFVNDNKWYFYQTAQEYIATISEVGTPLRVQKLQLLRSKDQYFLSFAFMEKAIDVERGSTVEDAILALRNFLEASGGFEFTLKVPGTTEVKTVTGSYVIVVPGQMTTASAPLNLKKVVFPKQRTYAYLRDEPKAKVEVKKGMSPGGLAGLSIAMLLIGIAVGIAAMYLYIKKYDNQSTGQHPTNTGQFPMKG